MVDSTIAYVAAPYSHVDEKVVEARMNTFLDVDALLIEQGYVTVSPLSKHFILNRGRPIPGDWNYWGRYSAKLLSVCEELLVLTCIPGWNDSKGVRGEIQIAHVKGIPIRAVDAQGVVHDSPELTRYVQDVVQYV